MLKLIRIKHTFYDLELNEYFYTYTSFWKPLFKFYQFCSVISGLLLNNKSFQYIGCEAEIDE